MRNFPMTQAALAAFLLTACGDDGRAPATAERNDAVPTISVRSAEQDRLHELNDTARDIGLKRAVTDSGMRCRRVVRSGYVQEYNKMSLWTAECEDRRSWAIFVGADGSAQVRPCADSKALGLPECRIAADPSGRTERAAQKAG